MLDTMRAFLALQLDLAATRRIADAAKILREPAGDWPVSWTPPTKYHVTLQFLGEVDVGLAPALGDVLRSVTHEASALRLRLGSWGAFPEEHVAQVLFVPVHDSSGTLQVLAGRVDTALQELGFPPVQRPFLPHVTIARFRSPVDLRERFPDAARHELGPAFGTEVVLCRSDISRPGAEYVTLARHGFLAPAPARHGSRPKGGKPNQEKPRSPRETS